ncbi:hypothetical protein L1887_22712 [Cichorium endivia]|nr:hypothetical protein L1887_22712 [Cichorium endivia]
MALRSTFLPAFLFLICCVCLYPHLASADPGSTGVTRHYKLNVGEWWRSDTEAVINQALQTGAGPNNSDAYTINGLPGPLYNNCSSQMGTLSVA